MDRIIAQIPDFFTWSNLALLGDAALMTLSMTLLGCLVGLGLALGLVFLRTTPGRWALPLRAVCILYVEVFRRIPFLVVIYLVLFFIQTIKKNGKPMVYRNEDTGWGWPPYFKFDTANLQADAAAARSPPGAPHNLSPIPLLPCRRIARFTARWSRRH